MQIINIQDYYEASYITGPRHATLQLKLRPCSQDQPASLVVLPPRGGGDSTHGTLDTNALRSAIQEGMAQANSRLHTSYQLERAGYLANDTPPYILYHILAYRITIHHHAVRLSQQEPTTWQKTFEIMTRQKIDSDTWALKGRAWLDIALNDSVFAAAGGTLNAYTITQLATYDHDVEILSRMMTGTVYVRPLFERSIAPTLFLYR